jgi:dinuclear metal center YbgI/SA1388 family protein
MATSLAELTRYCDETLHSARFSDYCPNGLQVEGRAEGRRLACAVTANLSVLEEARRWEADALLVHHGYFWRGEAAPVVGMKRRRLSTLLEAQMSLLAYHLPLDAHPQLGNNAQFGARLGFARCEPLDPADPEQLGSRTTLPAPRRLADLCLEVQALTQRAPLLVEAPQLTGAAPPAQQGGATVRRIGWCTGAAQGYLTRAAECGVEVFISGEISEQTVHEARELGVSYIAAGHHATERYGVQALAEAAAGQFDLQWRFIDCDNPV